jgi:hypothetical protein
MRPIDEYFLKHNEPTLSCLQFLREHILKQSDDITEAWRYGMPLYYYKNKMFCYLWTHKKFKLPYIGIVEGKQIDHPDLLLEKRARMKILLIDPIHIPIATVDEILDKAMKLYK